MERKKPDSIDEYIADFQIDIRKKMQTIRKAVHKTAPKTVETISWGMPTFKQTKILVQFAGFKKHIGFFPGPEVIVALKDDLTDFQTSKGGIHFPYDKPIPTDLITKIVEYRLKAVLEKTKL